MATQRPKLVMQQQNPDLSMSVSEYYLVVGNAPGVSGSDAEVTAENIGAAIDGADEVTEIAAGSKLAVVVSAVTKWISGTNFYTTLRATIGFLRGQYDPWQSFIPTNGQTVTLNYATSNSAKIDISGLGTGDSITLAASNWSSSDNNGMMTLVIKTGADPDVAINYLTGMVPPTNGLEASKENWFNVALNLNGDGYHLMSAGAF
jgi:hypothetical protein